VSYDYYVLKLTREITCLAELGPTTTVDLGSWSAVRQQVSSIIPGINWMDSGGSLQTENGWIEFGIASGGTLDRGFTIRASHRSDHRWEDALLQELCLAFNWSIIDSQRRSDGEHRSETYTMIYAGGVRQLRGLPEGSPSLE
jgi:hypothetical protein